MNVMELNEIPPSRALGVLPGLVDWYIRVRTWNSKGFIHHQFSVSRGDGSLYEYRCLDNGAK